jgi:hypothetical protein
MLWALAAAVLGGSYEALHATSVQSIVGHSLVGALLAAVGSVMSVKLAFRSTPWGRWILDSSLCVASLVALFVLYQAVRVWPPETRFVRVFGVDPVFQVTKAVGSSTPLGHNQWGFLVNASDDEVLKFCRANFEQVEVIKHFDDVPGLHRRLGRAFGFPQLSEVDQLGFCVTGIHRGFDISILRVATNAPVQVIVFERYGFKIGD